MARTRNQRLFVQLTILIVFTTSVSRAQSGISVERRMQIEYTVNKFMATSGVPGISVAVVENGEYEWSGGFGMADLENFVPATAHTLYRLASISKPITATAALQLWQRGKLDLDAPVQKYCPTFPPKDTPISTRQTLAHLAGIRHYKSGEQDDPETGNTRHFSDPIEAGLSFFKNDPLIDKPGNAFHYSTQGFTVAGCAIEGASGQKYMDFVRENVFVPAGMTHTRMDDRFAVIPYRTRFYSKDKSGAVVNAEFLDPSYKVPGGGWLSSAEDMAKFEVATLNDRLMTRATRDVMWTTQKAADGKETGYALGWGTGNGFGTLDVGHGGGQQGTSTFILMIPEKRAGVVVLMNMDGSDSSGLATELMKVLVGTATAGK
jgi:serine beta-lactamase-like protein LACTB, mitochondrial